MVPVEATRTCVRFRCDISDRVWNPNIDNIFAVIKRQIMSGFLFISMRYARAAHREQLHAEGINELSEAAANQTGLSVYSSSQESLRRWSYGYVPVRGPCDAQPVTYNTASINIKGNRHKPDLKIRFWCVYIP